MAESRVDEGHDHQQFPKRRSLENMGDSGGLVLCACAIMPLCALQ